MISVDLRTSRGKDLRLETAGESVEGWLVMDRSANSSPADPDLRLPMPISQGFARQSIRVFEIQRP